MTAQLITFSFFVYDMVENPNDDDASPSDRAPDADLSHEAGEEDGEADDGGEEQNYEAGGKCPECGGELVEGDGAVVCSDCGLVLTEPDESQPDWRKFDTSDLETALKGRSTSSNDSTADDGDLELNTGPPEGEVIVGFVSKPDRREHTYYRIDNAAEFFGDDWGDDAAMDARIAEAEMEPFYEASLPRADHTIMI